MNFKHLFKATLTLSLLATTQSVLANEVTNNNENELAIPTTELTNTSNQEQVLAVEEVEKDEEVEKVDIIEEIDTTEEVTPTKAIVPTTRSAQTAVASPATKAPQKQTRTAPQNEWAQDAIGNWVRYDENGQKVNDGWFFDDIYNRWFYFNEDGTMATGWIYDDHYNNWFYFRPGSGFMEIGWFFDTSAQTWFLFSDYGFMQRGWVIDNNIWYHFRPNGVMERGWFWYDSYQNWYQFGANGQMSRGLTQVGNDTYYFDNQGMMQFGDVQLDGITYHFNEAGILTTTDVQEKPEEKPEPEVKPDSKPEPDSKPDAKPDTKPEVTPEPETKPEVKPDSKPGETGWVIINGERVFINENGEQVGDATSKKIIDVSEWNGTIDWELAMEKNDIDGVIVRIGYAASGIDKQLANNIRELNRLDIPYGVYLYTYASDTDDAKAEAEFTLDILRDYDINLTYPIFYDVENWRYNNGSKVSPTDTQTWVNIVNTYCDTMEKAGYDNIGVYSYRSLLQTRLNHPDILKRVSWVAAYTDSLGWENPYYTGPLGWQYTSSAKMPGIKGQARTVDVSVWY